MSYERAIKAIRLQETAIPAQWESIQNPKWILSHAEKGERFEETFLHLLEEYKLDIVADIPSNNDNYGATREYIGNMSEDDVYRFDPFNPPTEDIDYVQGLGIHPNASIDEMADYFQKTWKSRQDILGDRALTPGAVYHQIVHYFSTIFGWEVMSIAAYSNPSAFNETVSRFAALTKKILTAWAETDVPFMLCHDDLAMADRSIFSPDWYRETIYPHYKEIWKPLVDADIPFIFYSDGKTDDLLPDIAQLGPSGFFMDDTVDFQRMAEILGETHFLLGGVKINAITFGSQEDIDREINRCLNIGKKCRSHIINCSGQIMPNVPIANADYYFNRTLELRSRAKDTVRFKECIT